MDDYINSYIDNAVDYIRKAHKIQKINTVVVLLLLGFSISSYLYCIIGGDYLQANYPYSSYLFLVEDKFNDFFNVLRMVKDNRVYTVSDPIIPACYFPFAYTVMYILTKIPAFYAFGIFIVLFVAATAYFIYIFLLKGEKIDLQTLCASGAYFFSYPFLFTIDRGNIEAFCFIFVGMFLISFLQKRFYLAIFFLALASALKLYPCVFAVLFIKNKQYKYCIMAGVCTLLITFFSYAQSIYKDTTKTNDSCDYYLEIAIYNKEEKNAFKKAIDYTEKAINFAKSKDKIGKQSKKGKKMLLIPFCLIQKDK